jgi:hypothetical protein
MASKEEINNQKELNKLLKEQLSSERELNSLRRGNVDIGFSINESIKEELGIRTKTSDVDKERIANTRAITKELLNQGSALADINNFNKLSLKNKRLIAKQEILARNTLKSLLPLEKAQVNEAIQLAEERDRLVFKEEKILSLISKQRGTAEELNVLEKKRSEIVGQITKTEIELDKALEDMGSQNQARLGFFLQYSAEQLKATQKLREESTKNLEPASNFLELLGAIPGFSGIANKALSQLTAEAEEFAETEGKALSAMEARGRSLKAIANALGDALTNPATVFTALGVNLVTTFSRVNELQTEFRRLTGESAEIFRGINVENTSQLDDLETIVSLTRELGFTQGAFNLENIRATSELRELLGVSAEGANRLAFFSQASGENLKIAAENINDTTDGAISVRNVLEDIAGVSDSIAITFGTNVELLGRAAAQARLLGLNLTQVDSVASRLLDIESSIAAEFEAEVITGKQLNLERARFFALTNDLAGLTEEIGKNEEILSTFTTGTRIEQEAIASALNLSRDEISKMIMDQKILNSMSAEDREQRELSDKMRLSVQDSINKSLDKMAMAIAPTLEAFASLLSNTTAIYSILGLIAGIKLIGLTANIAAVATALTGTAVSAATVASALTLGLGAVAIGAGIFYMINQAEKAKARMAQNIGDGIFPAGGRPMVSTSEGGLFRGTANDDILMGPGLARGRSAQGTVTLSDQQIKQIADAVRDGASRATITMDGGKVSSRLQTPMIVNTLPGV